MAEKGSHTVLVVDDDPGHRGMLEALLGRWGLAVTSAGDGKEAVARVCERPFDVVLMDIRMPDMDGITALKEIRKYNPAVPVVLMTAYSAVESAVEAMKSGAVDYLIKPLDFDQLKSTLFKTLEHSEAVRSGERFPVPVEGIVGNSPAVRRMLEMIHTVAPSEATVLINGKSGTGKELAARAVHECSARCDKPFIAVNCGAIPENLFESEFFGYKKGAFTGALADRKGCLDRADGGTLFLDELGELSLSAQTKLLRAIEGQGFTPVGGSDLHKPNFRIIAATNRNLAERVASGQMREDFFYRIHVIPIHLPPLRQRKEDIPLLIEYFLNAYPRVGDLPALNGEVMQAFMQYDWPGNIRELHNTLYRYLTLGKVQLGTLQVGSGQLPAGGQTGTGEAEHRQALPQEPLASALDRFEREYLLETLRRNDWKRAETADILGIDRRTLFRKIKQFDLEDEEGK